MARSRLSSVDPYPAPAGDRTRGRSMPVALFVSLRPRQWTKNLIVFAGLVGSIGERKSVDSGSVVSAVVAFLVFCVLSGVVYLINDVRDREADQLHPNKRHRPVAAGDLSPQAAITSAVILTVAALASAFSLSAAFGAIAAGYVVLLTLYSVTLKHVVILDVLTIALGFVLRAWAGAEAVQVSSSHWLLLLTLLGALVLGFGKRRAELVTLEQAATGHRRSLAEYSPYLLDQMMSVVNASTLLAYAFYTTDQETVAKFGTDRLLWTIPFPLYGIFRYLYLVHQREGGGDPSEMLATDGPLVVCGVLWVATVVAILYASR